ncbi:DUF3261 domain-containing protein [Cupriavidus sp. RAF12]|uniref:DUF3261 domain-containing protein n=1 Tax=Cupriavidus sp. RAF12 TaxID=3233050 RepID=UPI003F90978E
MSHVVSMKARAAVVALAALGTLTALAGCATQTGTAPTEDVRALAVRPAVPLLRLPPASLGRALNLQQQITVQYPSPQGEQTRDILALLEADAGHTRLAAVAGGQVLARLDWDGRELRVTRAPWAPAELVPERILSDLQLSLWPVDAIQAALPPGWRVDIAQGVRRLRAGDETVAEIRYPDAATTVFTQLRDGYRLTIRTLRAEGGAP